MVNFSNDVDILKYEPVLFGELHLPWQVLAAGSSGTLSGTTFTASGADFVSALVTTGQVIYLQSADGSLDGTYEIVSVDSATELTVSVIRTDSNDEPIAPPAANLCVSFCSTRILLNSLAISEACDFAWANCSAKVSIDAEGNLAQPRPDSIFEARTEQLAGSKVKLLWYYCPLDQNSEPACFKIYYDNGTGQIDYENSIATISYIGRKFYSYQSDSLEGDRYLFTIRVKDPNGVEDSSLAKLAIQITIINPDPIDILSAKTI